MYGLTDDIQEMREEIKTLTAKLAAHETAATSATAVWLNNAVHDYAFYFHAADEATNTAVWRRSAPPSPP